MLDTLSLSDILGYASIACWLGAQFPQVVENIQRQSCEGLALPFLANWLLGDISNLVGCILTHQLPFQKWLATYFVCVDLTLVIQYIYYYKPPKGPISAYGHIRSATSPSAIRRMSIDRGASRYRALSVAASNVAAAATLAAQQEELPDTRRRHGHKPNRWRALEGSTPRAQGLDDAEDYYEDIPSSMFNSFHSEGGRDQRSKRVSWSIERSAGRASSMGRNDRPATPTALDRITTDFQTNARISNDGEASHRDRDHTLMESSESLTQTRNSRSNRASRKGSTMVFLGVWALFGIGTLATGRRGFPSQKLTSVGRVISSNGPSRSSIVSPASFPSTVHVHPRQVDGDEDISLKFPNWSLSHEETPQGDPSSQQILGRVFAWLCTTLYLTSRLPQIWKNFTRKSVEGLSMYLFVFAFLGNVFYVASILTSPRRSAPPQESIEYIKESIPYLLGSAGTLIFDITIVGQSFCYRPRPRRHTPISHGRIVDEEAAGLLSSDMLSEHPPGDSAFSNRGRASRSAN